MSSTPKLIVALLAAMAALFFLSVCSADESGPQPADVAPEALPRMLELGSTTCVPCQMMEEVLDELRRDYPDRLRVKFIDVGELPEAGHTYNIRVIPTQIFLSPDDRELFRHEGYFATADIVRKWQELGYLLASPDDSNIPASSPGDARRSGLLTVIFEPLTRWLRGSSVLALGAALLWGVLSILLSPCHLASIPLIVGFIGEQGRITNRRAFTISSLFALGILVTIALIGAVTAAAGRMMGDVGHWGNYLVAGVFLLVGFHLLDVIPMPWSGPGQVGMKRKGALAAFILGLVFGIALGPCTFAYMAPMLGVVFKLGAKKLVYGVLLLAMYGFGHCAVIVLAGTCTGLVQRYLDWSEASRGTVMVKRLCGLLVILGGLYLIWIAR